jgi:beta-glucosidase
VADQHDQYRKWWLDQTINALLEARDDGVEIIGYFHWSLLDNFEWAEGYWPRFGLVEVNRQENMKRTIRPSAKWFASRIKQVTTDSVD